MILIKLIQKKKCELFYFLIINKIKILKKKINFK